MMENNNQKKNIAFWGTPDFTTDFLEILAAHNYVPTAVITNPDRPRGRGMELYKPAPKTWAQSHGMLVLQPEKIDDAFFEVLSKTSWDIFIVIAYGKILPEQIINLPRYGTINVHYSLLPKYRGATPVESAILSGDTVSGVVIQQMEFKLDTGPLLAQKEIAIAPNDTTLSLREKMNAAAKTMLPDVLTGIFNHTVQAKPQLGEPSVCKKIKKEDGEITLQDDPIVLDRKFRAYTPWPGIFFKITHRDKIIRVKITKAHYALADGIFVIEEVIPENEKRMTWQQFSAWSEN